MAELVRVQLCPVLAVEVAGRTLTGRELGSRKARTLLALLASARGRLVPVDRIVAVLWPEAGPADPAANVATLVSRSRRLLGDDVLAAQGRSYGFLPGVCSTDVDDARSLVEEARYRSAAGESALAAAAVRRALDVLGGTPALLEEGDDDWVLGVRREVEELRRLGRHLLAAAVTTTNPAEAAQVAADAVAADPYDERAVRDLMRALAAGAAPAAALTAYADLADRLRTELGTDPEPRTAALHLALLREEPLPAERDGEQRSRPRSRTSPDLVGRGAELSLVDGSWVEAGAGHGGLVLVDGEPGIGKTRLLDAVTELVEAGGGLVLRARCRPAERSLFLQPYVDALRPLLLGLAPAELDPLLHGHAAAWGLLVPELADLVDVRPEPDAAPAVERRRAYDAVASVLRRVARRRPVLLVLDDLQDGGAATVDLLGYLAGRLDESRVLLLAALRSEDTATLARLEGDATRVSLGTLPPSAVEALAAAAGLSSRAPEVLARTAGHALSVVECLRALAAGDAGVPESLAAAVRTRVGRLEHPTRELVEGASVLRGLLDPRRLAPLVATTELAAVHACEELTLVGLLHRQGTHYEFANDLVQECVQITLPPALAAALHRRAADIFADHPETMAAHAYAAGEPGRAAQGWLLAGQAAMSRAAVEDALVLFDRALEAGEDPSLRARVLLARARAHEALVAYDVALGDIDEALLLARSAGDRRLEMAALRARGGDVTVALRRSDVDLAGQLEAGLRLASELGDRRAESDFSSRLSALEVSALRFGTALERARHNLARCRGSASEEALVLALDGLKTVLAYLGDTAALREVLDELEPMLRRRRSTWLLQWAVFESSFVRAAEGDWAAAADRVAEAVELNGRSGYPAYSGFFRAHGAWFHRLSGDLGSALAEGERAVEQSSRTQHPWWFAAASGLLAATLLEAGRTDDAADVAAGGLSATTQHSAHAWRLRCLAPLAAAAGLPSVRAEATRLLESVETPVGGAWVIGSDAYLLCARSWSEADPDRGARLLDPLLAATTGPWGAVHDLATRELAQISSATS